MEPQKWHLSLSLSHCWCEHFLGSDSFSEPTQHAQWRFVSTWAHFLICHQFFSPKSFETGQQVNSATSPSRVLPMVHGCLLFVKWLPSFTGFPHQGSNRKREHWYEKWNKNRFDRCAAVGARTCRFKTAALLPSFFFFLPGFFFDLEVRNTGRVKRGPGVNGSRFYFSLVFFSNATKMRLPLRVARTIPKKKRFAANHLWAFFFGRHLRESRITEFYRVWTRFTE